MYRQHYVNEITTKALWTFQTRVFFLLGRLAGQILFQSSMLLSSSDEQKHQSFFIHYHELLSDRDYLSKKKRSCIKEVLVYWITHLWPQWISPDGSLSCWFNEGKAYTHSYSRSARTRNPFLQTRRVGGQLNKDSDWRIDHVNSMRTDCNDWMTFWTDIIETLFPGNNQVNVWQHVSVIRHGTCHPQSNF